MRRFVVTRAAQADLQAIWEHIAADSVDAADRLLDRVEEAFRQIASFPALGRYRPNLVDVHVRFRVVSSYYIIYKPDSDPLEIARIIHVRRDLRRQIE